MKKFFKQLLCSHSSIVTETVSSSPETSFMVSSVTMCKSCEKTFPQHPNAICCYVQHMHSQIILEYWTNKFKNNQQIK